MQECPVCTQIFPTDFIEAHASACGERYPFTCLSFFSHQQLSYSLCKCNTKYLWLVLVQGMRCMQVRSVRKKQQYLEHPEEIEIEMEVRMLRPVFSECHSPLPHWIFFLFFLLGWFTIADPAKAIAQCVENHLSLHKEENPLQLTMDIRSSPTEQDMALISFYKPPNVEWGRPLNCRLEGCSNIKFQLSN